MRALVGVVVSAVLLVASAARAQSIEFNLFGASSAVSFGFGFHQHRRRVVVAPPPVVVQQPVYVQPPPVYVQPAPVYVQPPPVYVEPAPPPVVMAPPPPPPMVSAPVVVTPAPVVVQQPAPQVVVRAPPPPAPERPALIGLKYTPGISGIFTSSPNSVGFSGARFTHSAGLEARLSRWFALRSDVELRNDSRSFDVIGLKAWLAGADWKVKPYLSVSLSGTNSDSRPNALSIGAVGAAGLDIFFGRHFFLEAEVRYRALPGSCCTEVPQITAVAGAGVAFF